MALIIEKYVLVALSLFLWLGISTAAPVQDVVTLFDQEDVDKRADMSVNLDLMAIARMMNKNKGPADSTDFLMRLGKRSGEEDYLVDMLDGDTPMFGLSNPQKRRPISVNQDLMSISRMMDNNQAMGAQNFLNALGKRASLSVNQDLMSISRMLGPGGRAADAQSFLLSLGKRSSPSVMFLEEGTPKMEGWKSFLQSVVKRRPLSINQDLMSISALIGDGGRSARAQSLLHALGKRSTENAVEPDTAS